MNSPFRAEFFLHLAFLSMSIIVIACSFWLRADDQRGIFLPGTSATIPPMCTSRILYGIECPGCGLTRAFIAISHGRFERAWELNRVSFFAYALVFGQIPWQTIQLWRAVRGQKPLYWFGVYLFPIGLAILLVVNWLVKLAGW